jgi:phage shock protein PspC (stress-responsive transcriptional regulator)
MVATGGGAHDRSMDETTQPTPDPRRRLARSTDDRMVAGVCGGIARYLDADPTVIRLVAVLLMVFGGAGVLAYVAAWVIIPEEGAERSIADDLVNRHRGEPAS